MMDLLSVIVPVYNAEKYLRQCVDSIIDQNYKNIEIILVDDGSIDRSGEICDSYQRENECVRVVHQKNRGCMQARLRGIYSSKGEYIGFVDSDDWIDHDMYETLMSIAKNKKCDIVSMGYTLVWDENKVEVDDATLFGVYEIGKNMDMLLSNMMYDIEEQKRGVHPSLCTKIIKRELLINAYSQVNRNITMGEDACIFYPCCLRATKIFITKEYKYFYRVHDESMCRTMDINTLHEIYDFYQYMQMVFQEHVQRDDLNKQLKKYILEFIYSAINQIFQLQVGKMYLFPYALIEKKTRIILYGAGEVGQSYYAQIMKNHYCDIVAWVDKDDRNRKKIITPGRILDLDYSKILIAVRKIDTAHEIMEELITLGVDKTMFLWDEPQEMEASFF